MKKVLIIAGILLAFLLSFAAAIYWYAMVQMHHEVVADNIFRAKGEVVTQTQQLRLETGHTEYTTHWLVPEVVIHEPVLTMTDSSGVYHISLEELRVRGSIWQYYEAELIPSDLMRVKRAGSTGELYEITVNNWPKILVRGKKPTDETGVNELLLYHEYQFTADGAMKLAVTKAESTHNLSLNTNSLDQNWHAYEFRLYPYVQQFVKLVTAKGHSSNGS